MGLYGFKKRFVPFILEGSKTHTIRALRAHPTKVGDICHCYTGLRQKGATLLGRWPCVKVETFLMQLSPDGRHQVFVDGVQLSPDECNALAYRDGFRERGQDSAFELMLEFWEERDLPFEGTIDHWRYSASKYCKNCGPGCGQCCPCACHKSGAVERAA